MRSLAPENHLTSLNRVVLSVVRETLSYLVQSVREMETRPGLLRKIRPGKLGGEVPRPVWLGRADMIREDSAKSMCVHNPNGSLRA